MAALSLRRFVFGRNMRFDLTGNIATLMIVLCARRRVRGFARQNRTGVPNLVIDSVL